MQNQSNDNCFDYDSANDVSDLDDLDEQLIALNERILDAGNDIIPYVMENADVVIISDDDDDEF